MTNLPDQKQQIVQHHATLIVKVVQVCHDPSLRSQLEPALKQSEDNGWGQLVGVLRNIMDGRRDEALLNALDEEDRTIVEAVLRGLQDPATLPDPHAKPDASMAAAGLAGLIHAAGTGDAPALKMISDMAEQMSQAGGDMARVASVIRPLVNGERDMDKLADGMSASARDLLFSIAKALANLEQH